MANIDETMVIDPPENFKKFYANLAKSGEYELPEINQMYSDLENADNFTKLYDNLSKSGQYELPDIQAMRKDFGYASSGTTQMSPELATNIIVPEFENQPEQPIVQQDVGALSKPKTQVGGTSQMMKSQEVLAKLAQNTPVDLNTEKGKVLQQAVSEQRPITEQEFYNAKQTDSGLTPQEFEAKNIQQVAKNNLDELQYGLFSETEENRRLRNEIEPLIEHYKSQGKTQEQIDALLANDEVHKQLKESDGILENLKRQRWSAVNTDIDVLEKAKLKVSDKDELTQINAKILDLQAQKEDFFLPAEKQQEKAVKRLEKQGLLSAEDRRTPQQKLRATTAMLNSRLEDLRESIGFEKASTLDQLGRTARTFFAGATPEEKEYSQIKDQLRSLAPVAILNESPKKKEVSSLESLGSGIVGGLSGNENLAPDALKQQQNLEDTLAKAGVDMKSQVNQKAVKRLQEDFITENGRSTDTKDFLPFLAKTTGRSLPLALDLALSSVIPTKWLTAPANLSKALVVAEKSPTFWAKMANVSKDIINTGLDYQKAGIVFSKDAEELNFLSGLAGGVGEKTVGALMNLPFIKKVIPNLFGEKTPEVVKFLVNRGNKIVGGGLGETGEELAQTTTELWMNSKNGQDFLNKMQAQFGDLNKATRFVASTFIMGAFMGGGNSVGQSANETYKAEYKKLNPEEKVQVDNITNQVKSDIETKSNEIIDNEVKENGLEKDVESKTTELNEAITKQEQSPEVAKGSEEEAITQSPENSDRNTQNEEINNEQNTNESITQQPSNTETPTAIQANVSNEQNVDSTNQEGEVLDGERTDTTEGTGITEVKTDKTTISASGKGVQGKSWNTTKQDFLKEQSKTVKDKGKKTAQELTALNDKFTSEHKKSVSKAIKDGSYEDAITKGEMTLEEAIKVIKSAGLEVPEKIQGINKISKTKNIKFKELEDLETQTPKSEVERKSLRLKIKAKEKELVDDVFWRAGYKGAIEGIWGENSIQDAPKLNEKLITELDNPKSAKEWSDKVPIFRTVVDFRNSVKQAITSKKYEKAIKNGELTKDEAIDIIKSAYLEVPQEIQNYTPTPQNAESESKVEAKKTTPATKSEVSLQGEQTGSSSKKAVSAQDNKMHEWVVFGNKYLDPSGSNLSKDGEVMYGITKEDLSDKDTLEGVLNDLEKDKELEEGEVNTELDKAIKIVKDLIKNATEKNTEKTQANKRDVSEDKKSDATNKIESKAKPVENAEPTTKTKKEVDGEREVSPTKSDKGFKQGDPINYYYFNEERSGKIKEVITDDEVIVEWENSKGKKQINRVKTEAGSPYTFEQVELGKKGASKSGFDPVGMFSMMGAIIGALKGILPRSGKRWFLKNFRTGGVLPNNAFLQKLAMNNSIESLLYEVAKKATELQQVFKQANKGKALSEEQSMTINAYLTAPADEKQTILDELPESTHQTIIEMGMMRDALSEKIRDMESTSQVLKDKINEEMGMYLNRAFEVFDNADWNAKVKKDKVKIENARAYLKNQLSQEATAIQKTADALKNRDKSKELDALWRKWERIKAKDEDTVELEKEISRLEGRDFTQEIIALEKEAEAHREASKDNKVVDDMIDNITSPNRAKKLFFGGSGGSLGKNQSWELSILKKRGDIAPEIRALMGEYTDAPVNFARTMDKMIRLTEKKAFIETLALTGVKEGWLLDSKLPAGNGKQTEKVEVNGKEYWATQDVKEGIEEFEKVAKTNELLKAYLTMLGGVKYGMTVLSPVTHTRNFASGIQSTMTLGNYNIFADKGGAFKTIYQDMAGSTKAEHVAKMKRYVELGIINTSIDVGEMKALAEDLRKIGDEDYKSAKAIKKALKPVTKMYQHEDNFWKIVNFESEVAKYKPVYAKRNPNLTTEEIQRLAEEKAGSIIRSSMPNYDMIPRFFKELRKFPLFGGSFIAFPLEIIRNTYNTLKLAAEELPHKDTRWIGVRRVAGIALAANSVGLAGMALGSLVPSMFAEVGDDDEKRVRELLAEYAKNGLLIFTHLSNGRVGYFDLASIDPLSIFKKPLGAFLRGDNWEKSAKDTIGEFLAPIATEPVLTSSIYDLLIRGGKTKEGEAIFTETDSALQKMQSSVEHILKNNSPGFVKFATNVIKGAKNEVNAHGRVYSLQSELAPLAVGTRYEEFDIGKLFQQQLFKYSPVADSNEQLYTRTKNNKAVADRDKEVRYQRANENLHQNLEALRKAYENVVKLGGNIAVAQKALESNRTFNKLEKAYILGRGKLPDIKRGHTYNKEDDWDFNLDLQ